jgi:hypothetical protein
MPKWDDNRTAETPVFIPMRARPAFYEARWQPRFRLDTNLTVYSREEGILRGRTVDLSESGLAAILPIEVRVGTVVELTFRLPDGAVSVRAVVRHKTAFRYGFQFVHPNPALPAIQISCRLLPPCD